MSRFQSITVPYNLWCLLTSSSIVSLSASIIQYCKANATIFPNNTKSFNCPSFLGIRSPKTRGALRIKCCISDAVILMLLDLKLNWLITYVRLPSNLYHSILQFKTANVKYCFTSTKSYSIWLKSNTITPKKNQLPFVRSCWCIDSNLELEFSLRLPLYKPIIFFSFLDFFYVKQSREKKLFSLKVRRRKVSLGSTGPSVTTTG